MEFSLLAYLLVVRLRSVLRFLKELGTLRLILFVFLTAAFVKTLLTLLTSFTGSLILAVAPVFIIASFQSLRKDENFIKGLYKRYRLFYFTEYLLISIFFMISLLFSAYYYFSFVLLLFCMVIPFLRTNIKPSSYVIRTGIKFPPYAFEWISGARRYWFFLGMVYLLSLIFSYEIGAVPLAMILIGFTVPSFYVTGEPRLMVEVFEMSPFSFLKLKIFSALKIFSLLSLPLALSFLLFNFDRWYLLLLIFFITVIVVISAVLTKYAFYEENSMISYLNALITGVIIFSVISAFYLTGPFLFILPFFMLLYLWRKANRNLNYYLNAYS